MHASLQIRKHSVHDNPVTDLCMTMPSLHGINMLPLSTVVCDSPREDCWAERPAWSRVRAAMEKVRAEEPWEVAPSIEWPLRSSPCSCSSRWGEMVAAASRARKEAHPKSASGVASVEVRQIERAGDRNP